jgi:hypothetical protein
VPKKAQITQERVEYNVFLFDGPLKNSKSLKMFKIRLTFRFDKLSNLSKSVHTGENSQILTVSNKKKTKWTHAVRTTAPNLRNYQIVKKNEPPGRKITLKINKWALLKATTCNKIKSTTYPYHVVLVPKQNTKKKATKVR